MIREEIQKLTEAAISFDEMFDAYGFSLSDSDEGVKFYLHSKAKLDGFAEGNKLASVGRMSGKDNKVFRNPIKLGFWLEKKFKLKNKYLEENKRLKLNEVPAFSSPEAKQQVDRDVTTMSKYLGKASQQVIKTMMDGVKDGRYDAMDLQRGIQMGPVKRAHFGEMDFIQQLWNKVRSGFRRYSKRGKLR